MCDTDRRTDGQRRAWWEGRVRHPATDKSNTIVIVRLAAINNAVFPAAVKKINPPDLRDRDP